jgi:hypothetical protein
MNVLAGKPGEGALQEFRQARPGVIEGGGNWSSLMVQKADAPSGERVWLDAPDVAGRFDPRDRASTDDAPRKISRQIGSEGHGQLGALH